MFLYFVNGTNHSDKSGMFGGWYSPWEVFLKGFWLEGDSDSIYLVSLFYYSYSLCTIAPPTIESLLLED